MKLQSNFSRWNKAILNGRTSQTNTSVTSDPDIDQNLFTVSFIFFLWVHLILIRKHTYDNDNENACRITIHLHKRTLYIPIHPTQTLGLRSPGEQHKLHTTHTNTRKIDNKPHTRAQRKVVI